jgi:hypothetical protein
MAPIIIFNHISFVINTINSSLPHAALVDI